jgi:hypothetical protein
VSAGLDALDRGVIEAGLAAAEALSRVAALEAEVAGLRRQLAAVSEVESIVRRAFAGRRVAPQPRRLSAVTPAGGGT